MARPAGAFKKNQAKLLQELRTQVRSNEDLAKVLGVTPRHVSRLLNALVEDGWIRITVTSFKHPQSGTNPTAGWCNDRAIDFNPEKSTEAFQLQESKLSLSIVSEIRRRHAEGAKRTALAETYGVSVTTISHIVNRKTWKV